MSPKIHYLHQHLDFFTDDLGKISDERGERFHQQIKKFEEPFQGKAMQNMLAEYVWNSFEEEEEQRCLQMGFMPRTRIASFVTAVNTKSDFFHFHKISYFIHFRSKYKLPKKPSLLNI